MSPDKNNQLATLPVYVAKANDNFTLHLVISPGVFRSEEGVHHEAMLPIIEEAIDKAQSLSGSELLCTYFVKSGSAEEVVHKVRLIFARVVEQSHPVLWIRTDSEALIRAVIGILKADFENVEVVSRIDAALAS